LTYLVFCTKIRDMVEKYKGLIPPGSIWFRLNRDDALALLAHKGDLVDMTPEQIESIDSADIQAIKGQVDELEQMFKYAGLDIITLFD